MFKEKLLSLEMSADQLRCIIEILTI
jgi:hypothetical protein